MANFTKLGLVGTIAEHDDIDLEEESSDSENDVRLIFLLNE